MRPRTFILIILVLLLAVAAVVFFLVLSGTLDVAGLLGDGIEFPTAQEEAEDDVAEEEIVQPAATPTPSLRFVPVVSARTDIPLGARLTEDLLQVERRPETNIAVQAAYTFGEVEEVAERIARVPIAEGQAILNSMIALSPTDLGAMGSDLALYVNQGRVAVAVPIDRYSGAAYAMRPGDMVDVLMSLSFVKIDEEFQTARPNFDNRIDPFALQDGQSFLFSPIAQGRLELVEGLNLVATVGPGGQETWEEGQLLQIPRRATQLTIQQAEVLWVGTWFESGLVDSAAPAASQPQVQPQAQGAQEDAQVQPTPTPEFTRRENRPDVVILSLTLQDALALKWAMDRGVDIDLALRSQGDTTVFATTSVSLPQLVEQGGLTIPERGENDIHPRADDVDPPSLPPLPPGGP